MRKQTSIYKRKKSRNTYQNVFEINVDSSHTSQVKMNKKKINKKKSLNEIFELTNHQNSIGSVQYSAHNYGFGGNMPNSNCGNNSVASGIPCSGIVSRAVHERSHSDGTQTAPLPSVDLSMESSSVTSLSNLPLRKTIASGKWN